MLIANCERAVGETVNIGSNTEISIKDLFELIMILQLLNYSEGF